jgi:hypothetical protein
MSTKSAKKPKSKKSAKKPADRKQRNHNGRDAKGRFTSNNPGRPKGSKNKTPQQLLDLFIKTAFEMEQEGKGKALLDCARQDRRWFYSLMAKMVPKSATVQTDIEGEITIKWEK